MGPLIEAKPSHCNRKETTVALFPDLSSLQVDSICHSLIHPYSLSSLSPFSKTPYPKSHRLVDFTSYLLNPFISIYFATDQAANVPLSFLPILQPPFCFLEFIFNIAARVAFSYNISERPLFGIIQCPPITLRTKSELFFRSSHCILLRPRSSTPPKMHISHTESSSKVM